MSDPQIICDILKTSDEQAFRTRHLPQTPRDVQRQIPASRQELMEHGEVRLTGAQARAKLIRNGSERDRDTDGVERDGNEIR